MNTNPMTADLSEKRMTAIFTDEKWKKMAEKTLQSIDKVEKLVMAFTKTLEKLPFGKYFNDMPTMALMVLDYVRGDYRQVPKKAITATVISMLYTASPIDIIPDFIPVVGYMDDLILMLYLGNIVADDLKAYKEWKGIAV